MTKNQLKTNVIDFMNELETIFSDIREKNVDDSVCGLCEYDCDHGLDGYANECPGFERDDCFKLKEEYRNEWINKIIALEQESQTFEWCTNCREYDQEKHCCPRYNKVIRNAVEEIKEPKVGHWVYDNYNWRCSECNEAPKTLGYVGTADFMTEHFKFCNHCGAKMIDVPEINDGKSEIPTGSENEDKESHTEYSLTCR